MSAWRRSMSSTRKMSEHPSPLYNLPDTGEVAEAAEAAEVAEAVTEAAAGEVASRFGGEVAAVAAAAAAVEAAGGGAIDLSGRHVSLCVKAELVVNLVKERWRAS
jgi:NTP pyrophosphatase (non-canonical NTP hydrolase)